MNDITKTKGIMSIFGAVIGYLYNCISEMVVVLIFLMLMDYFLGIAAAYLQNEKFNPDKAIKGAFKKLLYAFILALGFLGDYVIIYFSQKAGTTLPINGMVGIAVVAYLLGTEGFSCVKHCLVIGLPAPEFLLKFFGLLKDKAGNIVKTENNKEEGGTE